MIVGKWFCFEIISLFLKNNVNFDKDENCYMKFSKTKNSQTKLWKYGWLKIGKGISYMQQPYRKYKDRK